MFDLIMSTFARAFIDCFTAISPQLHPLWDAAGKFATDLIIAVIVTKTEPQLSFKLQLFWSLVNEVYQNGLKNRWVGSIEIDTDFDDNWKLREKQLLSRHMHKSIIQIIFIVESLKYRYGMCRESFKYMLTKNFKRP
jgi:hypothetical protein